MIERTKVVFFSPMPSQKFLRWSMTLAGVLVMVKVFVVKKTGRASERMARQMFSGVIKAK